MLVLLKSFNIFLVYCLENSNSFGSVDLLLRSREKSSRKSMNDYLENFPPPQRISFLHTVFNRKMYNQHDRFNLPMPLFSDESRKIPFLLFKFFFPRQEITIFLLSSSEYENTRHFHYYYYSY